MLFDEMPGPELEAPEVTESVPEPVEQEKTGLQKALENYWAVKPTKDCVDELIKKANKYYNYLTSTGKMATWRLCFEQYNRGFLSLASISRGGIEGELINFPVNDFRNALKQKLTLTTKEKIAWAPQATNSDYTTGAQVTVAKGLLNYYSWHRDVDELGIRTVENDLIFGEGAVLQLWNRNLGDIQNVDSTSKMVYKNGDIQHVAINPTNLIRDIYLDNFKNNLWFTVRLFVNKYELAVQYPDMAEELVKRGITTDWDNTRLTNSLASESDLVPMFCFFHKKTSALPFGRQIFYIDSDVVLEDGHLSSRDFPVKTSMPSPTDSINFGYTDAMDLLPLQQVIDILYSAIATNNTNFAVTNIIIPENCNLSVTDIIGGMNLLKYNPQSGKPEALNLTLTPKEVYDFLANVQSKLYQLAGVTSVQQGKPQDSLKSGAAIALVDMKALQFNSDLMKAHATFMAEIGTGIIHLLQDNADAPRLALICGISDAPYIKEFTNKDVEGIDRVTVTLGSAFAQTDSGRIQMAQDLIASGLMKDPQEYLEVVETGSLKRLTEGQHASLMLIKKENERLSSGQPCIASMGDDHATHILEHNSVISDPAMRYSEDPNAIQVVQLATDHIAQHMQLLSTMPPLWAAVTKQPVLNQGPAQPPPTGEGAGNGANAPKPAGPQAGGAPTAPQAAPPQPQGANQ